MLPVKLCSTWAEKLSCHTKHPFPGQKTAIFANLFVFCWRMCYLMFYDPIYWCKFNMTFTSYPHWKIYLNHVIKLKMRHIKWFGCQGKASHACMMIQYHICVYCKWSKQQLNVYIPLHVTHIWIIFVWLWAVSMNYILTPSLARSLALSLSLYLSLSLSLSLSLCLFPCRCLHISIYTDYEHIYLCWVEPEPQGMWLQGRIVAKWKGKRPNNTMLLSLDPIWCGLVL